MRLRLILSFILIILIALSSVLIVASFSAEEQVRRFLGSSNLAGVQNLVEELGVYYEDNNSWEGVESVFNMGHNNPQTTANPVASSHPDEDVISSLEGKGSGEGFGKGQGMGSANSTKSGAEVTPEVSQESVYPEETTDLPDNELSELINMGEEMSQGYMRGRSGHLLADSTGRVVYSASSEEIGNVLPDEDFSQAITIEDDGQLVGYLFPAGGIPDLPENFESQLITRIRAAAIVAAGISGFFALILALILSKIILKPVQELSTAANNLSKGDLEQRVTVKGRDELAGLGYAFNHMASSLQESEKQRQALTADIAHELRTPLAVQRASLEALQDGIYPLTINRLEPIVKQNLLLTRLVEDLRTLAMADSGELSLNVRSVNLEGLVKTVITQFEPSMANANLTIQMYCEKGLPEVEADTERVEQILHNLLQNALRYSLSNTKIDISLSTAQQKVRVDVRDRGTGIPGEALEKIFLRFYRLDKSREREKGGTGLGLAIAKKLAEAQGGDLIASNHPDGGAVFSLFLPVAKA